jgi:hypothetical protein
MLMRFVDMEADSRISKHTWRLWVKQRRIESIRLGRRVLVEEGVYRAFLAKNRVEAREPGR